MRSTVVRFGVNVLAVILVTQVLTGPVQTTHADTTVISDLAQALKSSGTVRAVLVLDSAPMVERSLPRIAVLGSRNRLDFESADAARADSELRAEQQDFEARARLIAPGLKVRAELQALANAVSVEARGTEIAKMAALPGVKRVELVHEVHAFLDASVPLINAPAMWDRLGGSSNAGAGIKIAIIDTGIDNTNPMFSDTGFTAPAGFPVSNNGSQAFTNNKVIAAKSFISSAGSKTTAQDENGHGTNVGGIAAGDFGTVTPIGAISGVAPRAFLGNYRVLDKNGSGADDLVAAGLEAAVRDGFDVANMSLGGDANSAQLDFGAQAVEAASAAGMVVCVAAGNSGAGGIGDQMTVASPGIAPSAITVASVTNAHASSAIATVAGPSPVSANLTNLTALVGDGSTSRFGQPFVSTPYAYVSTNLGCDASPAGSLTGKIALVERGTCNFSDKVNNAAAGGAVGVVIFNKDISLGSDGGENLIRMSVPGTTITSVFVARSVGLALRDFVSAHPDALLNLSPLIAADVVSGFSSRGPSIRAELKPDIAAPGESIYSAALLSVDPSGFASEAGTSQATPHISGSAALIRQQHPSWTPAQVKSALMSSATTEVFTTLNKTTKSGVLAMGSGRVDLARAANVNAIFSPASLSFGIFKLKKKDVDATAALTIANTDVQDGTFSFSVQLLDPSDGFTATLSTPTSMTVPAGSNRTINLSIHAVVGVAGKRDYTGLVNVSGPQGEALHVPFWIRFVKHF